MIWAVPPWHNEHLNLAPPPRCTNRFQTIHMSVETSSKKFLQATGRNVYVRAAQGNDGEKTETAGGDHGGWRWLEDWEDQVGWKIGIYSRKM